MSSPPHHPGHKLNPPSDLYLKVYPIYNVTIYVLMDQYNYKTIQFHAKSPSTITMFFLSVTTALPLYLQQQFFLSIYISSTSSLIYNSSTSSLFTLLHSSVTYIYNINYHPLLLLQYYTTYYIISSHYNTILNNNSYFLLTIQYNTIHYHSK